MSFGSISDDYDDKKFLYNILAHSVPEFSTETLSFSLLGVVLDA